MGTAKQKYSGGCQCGAVRFATAGELFNPHICHCRMCQKAFGAPFAAFVGTKLSDFNWTRGKAKSFSSASISERFFCENCGTPMAFRYQDSPRMGIAIGSFDDPASIKPELQIGIESKLPWFDSLPSLPAETTEDAAPENFMGTIVDYQHPDHDTDVWPRNEKE